ncbi:protein Njmu-R1-like [Glandiceps talaboti]
MADAEEVETVISQEEGKPVSVVAPDGDTSEGTNAEEKEKHYKFFALYTYHANRPSPVSTPVHEVNDNQHGTVADFLQKEAVVNSDLSISVIATDLSAEHETELRSGIAKRLSRGTVYSGSGNVAAMQLGISDMSSYCFYCLLRQPDQEMVSMDGDGSGVTSREYVVCFITNIESVLDLFRIELEIFSHGLLSLVDISLTEIDNIQCYLTDWYQESIEFLSRSVNKLQMDAVYLIHAAMMDYKLDIKGGDDNLQKDIHKLSQCCTLAGLLQTSRMNEHEAVDKAPSTVPLVDIAVGDKQKTPSTRTQGICTLTITGDKVSFGNEEYNEFCEDWAKALCKGQTDNPVYLRQVIENFKLKAIQDMNTLKRLIRQAENDHYALYRSCIFLNNCGNGAILLQTAKMEDHTLTSHDAQQVLKALEEFIEENGGFTSRTR